MTNSHIRDGLRKRAARPDARSGIDPADEAGVHRRGEAGIPRHTMAAQPAHTPAAELRVRKAEPRDLNVLLELEHQVFATDRLSRRSLQRFLTAPTALVMVADDLDGTLAGTAIVLFRKGSTTARLYSIGVAPHHAGRGVAPLLLAAVEAKARERGCLAIRLEVHVGNHAAIGRYRKSGYREFARQHAYYEDGGDALRFEKRLLADREALKSAPPYFPQTSEFTCGPACIMMALGWADRSFKPPPELEFDLWRKATTICGGAGPGGCDPYGMAVTCQSQGLVPELYVSHRGPYFLENVSSQERQRIMRLVQAGFARAAERLHIPSHLTPVSESVLMQAFDAGSVAIVLVSGYHMIRRGNPHWIFAFGRRGEHVLMHDPAAMRDEQGMAAAAETYAVPWTAFDRLIHVGGKRLTAAIVIRKGHS